MDEEQLHQVITTLREYPENSREWQKAMTSLLDYIQNSPKIERCNHLDYPEVLNNTLLLVAENIREFQPSSSSSLSNRLAAWINYKLRHIFRVRELFGKNDPTNSISTDPPDPRPSTIWELEDEIQQWQQQQNIESIGKRLKRYIERDPERRLRDSHPRNHPECNYQVLCQRLLPSFKNPPDKLAVVAREFQINYQTLVYHWKSNAIPLLQEIATEIGYQPN